MKDENLPETSFASQPSHKSRTSFAFLWIIPHKIPIFHANCTNRTEFASKSQTFFGTCPPKSFSPAQTLDSAPSAKSECRQTGNNALRGENGNNR